MKTTSYQKNQKLRSLKNSTYKPLGALLMEANLVSPYQVQMALQEQKKYLSLRLGEILTLHGWLKKETADFFAEKWFKLLQQDHKLPLEYYLQEAGLLTSNQIKFILEEKVRLGIKFCSIAVLNGWLNEKTLQFFINHLAPEDRKESIFPNPPQKDYQKVQDPWFTEINEHKKTYQKSSSKIDYQDMGIIQISPHNINF
jgi:hypothetical protein